VQASALGPDIAVTPRGEFIAAWQDNDPRAWRQSCGRCASRHPDASLRHFFFRDRRHRAV